MIIVITVCVLLLLAYLFDITSSKTKIPTVIVLLTMGWGVRQIVDNVGFEIPELNNILPVLGTVGLILIVLEGSMELEIDKRKIGFIGKSALVALIPILLITFGLGFILILFENISFKNALSNAVPFAIISSAIAIPSAKNLISRQREFITYESSFSDILGVIVFNFLVYNEVIDAAAFGHFFQDISVLILITIFATIGLTLLLSYVEQRVKFIPIIVIVVLLYAVTKLFHIPGLLLIMIFGLFLANLKSLSQLKFAHYFRPESLMKEKHKFEELTNEIAFLVRTMFFLLFGFLIETSKLFDFQSFIWAALIFGLILSTRYIILQLFKEKLDPLWYIAPRGLITILLYLSLPDENKSIFLNNTVVLQVILMGAFFMMFGLMKHKKEETGDSMNDVDHSKISEETENLKKIEEDPEGKLNSESFKE